MIYSVRASICSSASMISGETPALIKLEHYEDAKDTLEHTLAFGKEVHRASLLENQKLVDEKLQH